MSPPSGDRRYTEREVAQILLSASSGAERQETGEAVATSARSVGQGLTLAQLEEVALEAGLDGALVRRAAREVDVPVRPDERPRPLLGGATAVSTTRLIAGGAAAMSADATREMVLAAARRLSGDLGDASQVGRTFGWRGRWGKARLEVELAPDREDASLRVRATLDEVAADAFGSWAIGAGGGGAFVAVALTVNTLGMLTPLVGGTVFGAGWLLARARYARLAARHRDDVEALADLIAARLLGGHSDDTR